MPLRNLKRYFQNTFSELVLENQQNCWCEAASTHQGHRMRAMRVPDGLHRCRNKQGLRELDRLHESPSHNAGHLSSVRTSTDPQTTPMECSVRAWLLRHTDDNCPKKWKVYPKSPCLIILPSQRTTKPIPFSFDSLGNLAMKQHFRLQTVKGR